MIYGLKSADYDDVKDTRTAANDLLKWVEAHPGQRLIATNNNPPSQ